MPGVVPDQGEAQMLTTIVESESMLVRLYVNDHTPGLADTLADYVEMSTHGYAPKTVAPGDWTVVPAQPGTNTPAHAQTAMQTFVFTIAGAPVTVYGYLLTGALTGTLYVAQAGPAPLIAQNAGDEIGVRPLLRLRSGYPA